MLHSKFNEQKKIGLFGGTFDPIHYGHLNLAFELMEKKKLDEVWFIPAFLNPLKQHHSITSFEHRSKMVSMAIQGIPQFSLKEIEKELPSPSYTLQTLKALRSQMTFPFSPLFYLFLGEDVLTKWMHWKSPEEILDLASLLIGTRSVENFSLDSIGLSPKIREAVEKGLTKTRLLDISSTEIRKRISSGLFCGHLLPSSVIDYIHQNHLYLPNSLI